MYDIYITREARKVSLDKSVKVIENIKPKILDNTIKKFNEDLGNPEIVNGYIVWENNVHRVEAVILDTNSKMKVDFKDFSFFFNR